MPSERHLSPLPLPLATSPSPFLPTLLSLIQKTSFLSTLPTPVYSDGVTNSSMNTTNASSTSCGTAGRAHAKRLTRKRTEGGPSLPTYWLHQEVPTPRENTDWSSFQGPGYSWAETICPGETSNAVGYPAGFVPENGPIPTWNLPQCCSGPPRIVTPKACRHPPVMGTGIVINETPLGSRGYYGKPSRLSRSPGIVSTKRHLL